MKVILSIIFSSLFIFMGVLTFFPDTDGARFMSVHFLEMTKVVALIMAVVLIAREELRTPREN